MSTPIQSLMAQKLAEGRAKRALERTSSAAAVAAPPSHRAPPPPPASAPPPPTAPPPPSQHADDDDDGDGGQGGGDEAVVDDLLLALSAGVDNGDESDDDNLDDDDVDDDDEEEEEEGSTDAPLPETRASADDPLLAQLAMLEAAPTSSSSTSSSTSAKKPRKHSKAGPTSSTAGEAFFAAYRNTIGLPPPAAAPSVADDEAGNDFADDGGDDGDEDDGGEGAAADGGDGDDDDIDAGFGRIADSALDANDELPMPDDDDDDEDGGDDGGEDELLKQLESVEVQKLAQETMPDSEELEPRTLEVTCITRARAVRVGVKPQTTYAKLARSVRAALGTPGTSDDSADPYGVVVVLVSEDGGREEVIGGLGDVAVMTPHATDLQLSRQKLRYRLFWAPTSNIGSRLALPGVKRVPGAKTPPTSPGRERRATASGATPATTASRESKLQQMMAAVSSNADRERRAKNVEAVRQSFQTTRQDSAFDRQVKELENRLATQRVSRTERTEADRRIVAHESAASVLRRTASADVVDTSIAKPAPAATAAAANPPLPPGAPPPPTTAPPPPPVAAVEEPVKKAAAKPAPAPAPAPAAAPAPAPSKKKSSAPTSPRDAGTEKKSASGAKSASRIAAGMFDKRKVSWLPRGLVRQTPLTVRTTVAACLAAIGAEDAPRGAPAVPIVRDGAYVGMLRSEHLLVYLLGVFPVKELAPGKTASELVPSAMFAAAATAAGQRLVQEDAQVLVALGGEAGDTAASRMPLGDSLKAALSTLGQRCIVPLDGLRTRAAADDADKDAVGVVTPNILLRVTYEYLKSSHAASLVAQLRTVPLFAEGDLVQVPSSTATVDVLTTMRGARASAVAVVHGTTLVGCFTVLHLARITPATLGALALPVIDFLAASDAELARCADDAQLRPSPGLPRALPRAGLLLNIEVRDTDAPAAADDAVLFRSRLMLVPARWLVVELLRHVARECAALSDVGQWKAVLMPRNAICNDNAKLQFYNISPDDLVRVVRRGGERVAVTAAAAAATASAPRAVAAAPPPLPPSVPILTPSSTLRDACALLTRAALVDGAVPPCDAVWIVDDVHHRRLLAALSTTTLLRFLVRGVQGAPLVTRRVVHSVVSPLAPVGGAAAGAGAGSSAAPAPRRSTDAVASGAPASSLSPPSARREAGAALSRNKSVSVLSDKTALEEMERQVHMKRKQSIRHILSRKKLDVVDRTVVAALFGAEPGAVMKRERGVPPSFVERSVRYLEKHVGVAHLFGERERELRDVAAAREKLLKRDPDLPPPVREGDVANLRALAEKGAMTIDLDVQSTFSIAPLTVAAALREYMLELPEPLLSYALLADALGIIDNKVGNKARVAALAELLPRVPKAYSLLVRVLLALFGRLIAGGAAGNTPAELAAQFACAFLRPRKPERAAEASARVPHAYEPAWVHADSAWLVAGQEARRGECAELVELLIESREQLLPLLASAADVEKAFGIDGAASTSAGASPLASPRDGDGVDLGDSVHAGWLMKQSPAFHKSWQRRWFVLKSHYLFYSRTEDEDPIGLLKIGPDTFVNLNPKNPLAFNVIAKDKVLHLAANTKEEMTMWCDAIDAIADELKE